MSRLTAAKVAIAGTAASLAVTPLAAASSTVIATPLEPPKGSQHNLIVSGDGGANVVSVADRGNYVVTDESGLSVSRNCSATTPTAAQCSYYGDLVAIGLRGGSDRLAIDGALETSSYGEGGDDQMLGGAGSDSFIGGSGQDILNGRSGTDFIGGQGGRDRMIGGAGRDRLFAVDGQRDQVIRCGAGKDSARVDVRLDPEPVGCERVIEEHRQPHRSSPEPGK